MKKLKVIDKLLDSAWSKLVKLRAGNKCEIEFCGKTRYLNSHHIFTRRNKAVRWNVLNGVALCPGHHTLYSKFSAHATPVLFHNWMVKTKGQNFIDKLTLKASGISKLHKFEKEIILKELNHEIKHFTKLI